MVRALPQRCARRGALDRLINASHHVTLEGKSYRPRQRPDVKDRSEGTRSDDADENEALRSPRTPAAERARVMTLGAKGVKTKRN